MENDTNGALAVAHFIDPNAHLVVEGPTSMQDAANSLPSTFLVFADPTPLNVNPDDEEGRLEALAAFVSPQVVAQLYGTSDRPVVVTTEKVLNALLPPRTYTYTDALTGRQEVAVQPVSAEQIGREALRQLKQEVDQTIVRSKVKLDGICSVRSSLYAMLFDELIRQTTIDCPERGILLLRIRNELQMTLDTLKALHSSATHYGAQKLHHCTRGVPEMIATRDALKREKEELQREERRLRAKLQSLHRCVDEQVAADRKRFSEEHVFLESTIKRLQQHLESVKQLQEQERRALMGLSD